jgi:hypothetical protein
MKTKNVSHAFPANTLEEGCPQRIWVEHAALGRCLLGFNNRGEGRFGLEDIWDYWSYNLLSCQIGLELTGISKINVEVPVVGVRFCEPFSLRLAN